MELKKRLKEAGFFHYLGSVFFTHRQGRSHPHLFLFEVAAVVIAIVLASEAPSVFKVIKQLSPASQVGAVLSAVVIDLTNVQRQSEDLSALVYNPLLEQAAQNAANDMATKGYFAHVNSEGKTPVEWLKQVNYPYKYVGENIAVNFTDSKQLVGAWMNSPSHKANILGHNFTDIGVGMATGTYKGQEAMFVVQFFASKIFVASTTPALQATSSPSASHSSSTPERRNASSPASSPLTGRGLR